MALEIVGGALLSAFLQVAFEKLASPQILHFFRARELDQKLLNKLETKLHSVHYLAQSESSSWINMSETGCLRSKMLSLMQRISWMIYKRSPKAKWMLNLNLKPSHAVPARYSISSNLLLLVLLARKLSLGWNKSLTA